MRRVMLIAALALVPARPAQAGSPRSEIARLIQEAAPQGTRVTVEPAGAMAPGCSSGQPTLAGAVQGSGRVLVRFDGVDRRGRSCTRWLWVGINMTARQPELTRALQTGEPLEGAVLWREREVKAGHFLMEIAPDAVAARPLPPKHALIPGDVRRPTLQAGTRLAVIVQIGPLMVEQQGRSVPCAAGRSCAVLPGGRHVEGELVDGRLIVRSP